MPIIVKYLTTHILCDRRLILLSKFIPFGLRYFLKKIPEDHYIIGVGYSQGDFQICMSGRSFLFEDPFATLNRELHEELALELKPEKHPSREEKIGNRVFYDISIDKVRAIPPLEKEESGEHSREGIVGCVHGSESDVVEYLKTVELTSENGDDIHMIWAAPKNIVFNAVEAIINGKRKGNYYLVS